MKAAVLDLGTNTFHLLIGEIGEGDFRPLYRETIAVQLGREGLSNGSIHPDALKRAELAISRFHDTILRAGVACTRAFATSAIRTASNGPAFAARILETTGISIDPISGEKEAELIYKGVRRAVPVRGLALIVDIGGGSTEFIIADAERIHWKKSFLLGAARMMERFHRSDPISPGDQAEMLSHFKTELSELRDALEVYKPDQLIGSAGAFETFAVLSDTAYRTYEGFNGRLNKEVRSAPSSHQISREACREMLNKLLISTRREREDMPEIPAVRKDMIISAAVLTGYVLDLIDPEVLDISVYSMKEGMMFDLAESFRGI